MRAQLFFFFSNNPIFGRFHARDGQRTHPGFVSESIPRWISVIIYCTFTYAFRAPFPHVIHTSTWIIFCVYEGVSRPNGRLSFLRLLVFIYLFFYYNYAGTGIIHV